MKNGQTHEHTEKLRSSGPCATSSPGTQHIYFLHLRQVCCIYLTEEAGSASLQEASVLEQSLYIDIWEREEAA